MMNRRDLLKAAALGAAASWLPAWRREEKIRLGVASYSLRKFKRAQAIEMTKACETPYINVKSFHLPYTLKGDELVAARKEFDDAGLKVVGSGNNSLKNEKEIADAGARVLDFHIKDLKDLMNKNSQCPVGEGKMPIAEIFKQLIKQKFEGYVNLEYEIEENDPLPGMKKSFAHMRKVAAEL